MFSRFRNVWQERYTFDVCEEGERSLRVGGEGGVKLLRGADTFKKSLIYIPIKMVHSYVTPQCIWISECSSAVERGNCVL